MRFEKDGKRFQLRGVNLGSWLNIEDFMLGLEGTDWQIRRAMQRHLGSETTAAFFAAYERHFVTEADLREIARLGFNSVRVPFNYRYFESDAAPGEYRQATFELLDRLYDWCAEANLWVLLDYHAAPRGQNATPPADNPTGYADLWKSAHAQDRVVELWKALARRYAKHPANLGYNLLNEPQTNLPNELSEDRQVAAMNALNHRLIREIRAIDPDGWIVIEGPVRQCGGNDKLDDALFEDPRTAATFHHYPLFENSLNLPGPRLPENDDVAEHTAYIVEQTRAEQAMMERTQRPMLLGEYGLSARWNPEQALAIFQAQTDAAEQCGFGWMIWTWKDIWRLGLVTPREDTPWFQFTRGEKMLARVQALGSKLGSFFDGVADDLPETAADRELRGMAMDDMRRGLNRLILDAQIRELAARPTAEILAMPEAFKLENCRLREHYYDAVKPYLAR